MSGYVKTKDGTEIFLQGLGARPTDRVSPWLAAQFGRLGTRRCCFSCSTVIGSLPTTAAATAAPRRPPTAMTWTTYAADAAAVVEALNLKNAVHIGHSTGGGEVARYVARYGKGRVAKAILVSAVPPPSC